MIGMEGLHAYQRFTFGIRALGGGVDLIPAMVGAFGLAEILGVVKRRAEGRDRLGRRPGGAELARDLPVLAHHHPLRA